MRHNVTSPLLLPAVAHASKACMTKAEAHNVYRTATAVNGMSLGKRELPGATLLGNAVYVIWKRNDSEYAWSFYALVECLICQAPNAAAGVASAASRPSPNATGGQKRLDGTVASSQSCCEHKQYEAS